MSAQNHYTPKQIDSLITTNEKPNDWSLEKNISFLSNLYKESEKIHFEKGMYRSLMQITNWCMLKGQYKRAFPYFEKTENLPLRNPENIKYKIKALQSKSLAFSSLGLYDDAQVAIGKSMHMAEKLKDNDSKFRFLGQGFQIKYALCIEMKKPEDSARFYLKKSIPEFKKIKNETDRNLFLGSTYINISTSFFEAKKLDSAKYYSFKALAIKNITDESKAYLFQTIGQIHREKKNQDSAFYYYNNAEKLSSKFGDPAALKALYQTLSDMYSESGDKDKALLYAKKLSLLSDSINVVNKESAALANKNIKEDLKKQSESDKKRLYWIIGGIIIILLFISWYLVKKYNKEKKAQLEKKEIIQQKDFELNDLKSKVNDSFEEVALLAKNNDSAFLGRFKEVYPDFCNKLQQICPDILNSELIFCAYLKLNFSTKDIATYTFVTPKAVYNRKNRIRKRLDIPSDEDIYLWMNKI
ncbi:hypothetical protein ACFO4P_10765 [Epilithonimonas pallida]